MSIRRERNSGYKRPLTEIYHIEFIALQMIDEYFELYRFKHERELANMIGAFLGVKR